MKADFRLASAFLASYPGDAAQLLEQADPATSATLLCRFSAKVIAEILRKMDPVAAAAAIVHLPADQIPAVLSELPPANAAVMLRPLDAQVRERVIAAAPEVVSRPLRTALAHSGGSAGSLMDSNVLTLPSVIDVGEARRRVQQRAKPAGSYLYVVDRDHRPVGVVKPGALMLAAADASIASVMHPSVMTIRARAGTEAILAHRGWRELHALPVVDSEGVLVGVLRREIYEQLRETAAENGPAERSDISMALAELFWTLTVSLVDELGQLIRPKANRPRVESSDDR